MGLHEISSFIIFQIMYFKLEQDLNIFPVSVASGKQAILAPK